MRSLHALAFTATVLLGTARRPSRMACRASRDWVIRLPGPLARRSMAATERDCAHDGQAGGSPNRARRHMPKNRGRPKTTGRGKGIMVRLLEPQMLALNDWIREQPDTPSCPEAIRRLVGLGLAKAPAKPRTDPKAEQAGRALAEKAAGEQIDRMGSDADTSEERATRKRRLLKGPREFRDVRK
jgi:hypothetical protein